MKKVDYSEPGFLWLELTSEDNLSEIPDSPHARVSIPSSFETGVAMEGKGYRLVDRTLEVKIPLKRREFDAPARMTIVKTDEYPEQMRAIAFKNFTMDNRFLVSSKDDSERLYEAILGTWMEEVDEAYVAIYKDEPIGFIFMDETYEKGPFIKLAVTEEKYRLTGVGPALYNYVAKEYKEKGCAAIYGRVSSRNTAVINIYSSLGGQFSDPWDIYLKR